MNIPPSCYRIMLVTTCLLFTATTFNTPLFAEQPIEIVIGTGQPNGVYHPIGKAICDIVSTSQKNSSIKCTPQVTAGSKENIAGLKSNRFQFAIVQSDVQHYAYEGIEDFSTQQPYRKLRTVFSMYRELFTVMVRADSNINTLQDLKGKRVNTGKKGSGLHSLLNILLRYHDMDESDFASQAQFSPTEMGQALCNGKVDVIMHVVGHPSPVFNQAAQKCATRLIALDSPQVLKMIDDYACIGIARIPGGIYPGHSEVLTTFEVRALLLSSNDTPSHVVNVVVNALIEHLDQFRRTHSTLSILKLKEMVSDAGDVSPIHAGALQVYQKRGLMY